MLSNYARPHPLKMYERLQYTELEEVLTKIIDVVYT